MVSSALLCVFFEWEELYQHADEHRDDSMTETSFSSLELFATLDHDVIDQATDSPQSAGVESLTPSHRRNGKVDESLRCAIYSYTAHWLTLVSPRSDTHVLDIVRRSWRITRKEMLKVINQESYQSILAMYLFAQTPIPTGISELEEREGICGPMCIQIALSQLQRLRERRLGHCATPETSSPQRLALEDRVYWAAMMWDVSHSLSSSSRTSLTAGLKGACSEPTWRLVRAYLFGPFLTRVEHWHSEGLDVTDDTASKIIAAAAICKTYMLKHIASLKEAFREGVSEDGVLLAWGAMMEMVDLFRASIQPLLHTCRSRIHFLSRKLRLNWYEVCLHYHLAILLLLDTVETAHRYDLLAEVLEARRETEHVFFDVLLFGLQRTYMIQGPRNNEDSITEQNSESVTKKPVFVSLVAIDPFPHLAAQSVLLMDGMVRKKVLEDAVCFETYIHLSSILISALEQLPQSSKYVQFAMEKVRQNFR